MSRVKLSKPAATRIISFTSDAQEALLSNVRSMDSKVNFQFAGMQDPALKRYAQLSEQLQNTFRKIGENMEAISKYCRAVIRWIDEYSAL